MTASSEVAVVGAGPYGLSLATHLKAAGIDFRIFGNPMQVWRERMPDGMTLKSDGFASNLSDPVAALTLKRFCETIGTEYDDTRIPVSLDTFRAYGLAFQRRLVPELEQKQLTRLERDANGFHLWFDDQSEARAHTVVLAVGITHFAYMPPMLAGLSPALVSHASAHSDLSRFRGCQVTVIGGGASAIDLSALLHEGGARVTLIARRKALRFADPPAPEGRSFWDELRHPSSTIGPGWRSFFYTHAPWAFHRLPQAMRLSIVPKHNGPAAGWPMKDRFVGKIPTLLGHHVVAAEATGNRVSLTLSGDAGTTVHAADHVIAATGYRVDLRRLAFLSEDLVSSIRAVNDTPVLSPNFESSVAGLYFVGAASANSFGPMMRFACGSDWTARRVTRRLDSRPHSVQATVAEAVAR